MNERYNLVGQKFGRLAVKSFSHQDKYKHNNWNCVCDCGGIKITTSRSLKSGKCKSCGCLQEEFQNSKRKLWEGKGYFCKTFLKRIEIDAVKRNLEFNISLQEAQAIFDEQSGKCALSGLDLDFGKRSNDPNRNASLDRIDSSKGYTKDNVQWLHKQVNTMKWDLSEERFLELVTLIKNNKGL